MNIEWDSKTYGEKCAFVGEHGKEVVDLLSVPPGRACSIWAAAEGS